MKKAATLSLFGLFIAFMAHAQSNRIFYNGQPLFLNGINLAWQFFGDDVGPDPSTPDLAHFSDVFSQMQTNGGNCMRFWVHANGAVTPAWSGSNVTGPGANTINDLTYILDTARQYDVGVILTLWSFDMLKWQYGSNVVYRSMNLLTNPIAQQLYIQNALTPMVQALGNHPAVVAWEVINEPEWMTYEFGTDPTNVAQVSMTNVQAFINVCAGAIHKALPKALVTTGAFSLLSTSDVGGSNTNYYSDAKLKAAGGDVKGTLDFYSVHYYDWMGTNSPFAQPYSYWFLDKPLVVAEFFPPGGATNCLNCGPAPYETLFTNGYAGALTWSWTDTDHASMLGQLASTFQNHQRAVELVPLPGISLIDTNTVAVTWTSPSIGWDVRQNTDMTKTNWIIPPQGVNDDGAEKVVVSSPINGNMFFRLQRVP